MARRTENGRERDGEAPHPRETFALIDQSDALFHAARAIRGGYPPQAWLISGPPGVGKATLAYRIARYILKYGASESGPEDLSVPASDPVAIQVAARSHPGLQVLERGFNPETGRAMTVLSVTEIRKLSGFFGLTSGAGGWRIAIIDTADDMNDAAANALLKILEEPPPRAMLMLLASAPGKLLSTIRSRCQRLILRPAPLDILHKELGDRLPDMSESDLVAVAKLAGGSFGLALELATGDGLQLARDADSMIEGAAVPDTVALMGLADRLVRLKDGPERLGDFLTLKLSERIRARARTGVSELKPWIDAWEKLRVLFARTHALHLDPRQAILSAAHVLTPPTKGETL